MFNPKAITFPTDAKLRYRAILGLSKLAKEQGMLLRQSYVRVSKRAVVSSCRYRHAKQRFLSPRMLILRLQATLCFMQMRYMVALLMVIR